MKTYEFVYSGSSGKCDSWEGTIDVDLTEEDYKRVEASIAKGTYRMRDDPDINDIYLRIYEMIVDETLLNEKDIGMIEEHRSTYRCDKDASEREVIETYLSEQGCSINYPYELQEKYWENHDEEE